MALTDKQQAFVDEYLVTLNAADAARKAGYSAKTAAQMGHKLLGDPEVANAITAGKTARAERTQISQDKVLAELAAVAFFDLRQVATWDGDEVTLTPSGEIPDDAARALREVVARVETVDGESSSRTTRHIQVKANDKMRALELLGRHLGLFNEDALPIGPVEVVLKWPEQAE